MLSAKIQEIDLLVQTKASQAELQVIKNNKVGQEEIQEVEDQIKQIKSLVSNLEGDDNDEDKESEIATPMNTREGYRNSMINYNTPDKSRLAAIFQDYLTKLKQDQVDGKSLGFKKHLKYHQMLIIEIVNKLMYDDDRFENMRNEILTQREQIDQYKKEKDELIHKVHNNVEVIGKVDNVLSDMNQFKELISEENEKAQEIVKKSSNECISLNNKVASLSKKTDENQKDTLKRIIMLESNSRGHDGEIACLKLERAKIDQIVSANTITIKDNKYKIENMIKEFEK